MKMNSLHEKPRDTAASERACESDSSRHVQIPQHPGEIQRERLSPCLLHKARKYVGEFSMMASFTLHWPRLDHTSIPELSFPNDKGTLSLVIGF